MNYIDLCWVIPSLMSGYFYDTNTGRVVKKTDFGISEVRVGETGWYVLKTNDIVPVRIHRLDLIDLLKFSKVI